MNIIKVNEENQQQIRKQYETEIDKLSIPAQNLSRSYLIHLLLYFQTNVQLCVPCEVCQYGSRLGASFTP